MSSWTYVHGQVTVSPIGMGQHAKRFVLEEVLDHLPKVPGSEGPMVWHVIQKAGHNHSSNCDEFGMRTNLSERGWWEQQSEYIVVLEAYLRDTYFDDTLKAFCKWLNRLSKRVYLEDILVKVTGRNPDYTWHEKLFTDPSPWQDNYMCIITESRSNKDELDVRKSINWRYEIMADMEFWPDILINLLPGGRKLAANWDLIMGNKELVEYLEWDNDIDDYSGINAEKLEFVANAKERVEMIEYVLKQYSKKDEQCEK